MRSKMILLLTLALGLGCLVTSYWLFVLGTNLASSPALAMSSKLKAFLAAEDLDDVGEARDKINSLTEKDMVTIREILVQWRDTQAVSNLLMHADLIPQDVRLASLYRGLTEQRVHYYVVAALVGLGEVDGAKLSAEDRKRLTSTLLAILAKTKDIRSKRTSLILNGFASASDSPQVIGLMEHPDETVRRNLRWSLFKTFESRGFEALIAATRKSSLSEEAQRRLLAEFKEFLKITDQQERNSKFGILFPYIPNMKDYEPESLKADNQSSGSERGRYNDMFLSYKSP